ncbi:MAG: hypothetical protein ACR2F6_09560 [Mycobacteriales bacterium]
MEPTEKELQAINRFAVEAAADRAPREKVVATAVVMVWPVWAGLPTKRASRRAINNPMLVMVTESRVVGLRVVPDIYPRGYSNPSEIEMDEPNDGVRVARWRSGIIATRADLVVPAKNVLIHARAPRQWRSRFVSLIGELEPGDRAGDETVLR